MGKLYRMMLVAAALSGACHRSNPAEEAAAGNARADRQRAKAAKAATPDARLDADGKLKESARHANWLAMPVGFEQERGGTAQLSAWNSDDLALDKVRDYLLARLSSDRVEYSPHGVWFHQAHATHTSLEMPPLDVMVTESADARRSVHISVEDRTPSKAKPLPDQAAAQALVNDRAHQE